MENIEKYYNNTESKKARKNVKYFNEKIKYNPGKAIELGCGAGNDTIYLIKNGWNVLAIDRENVKERITKRLNSEESKKFRFQKQNFESIELEKSNLIVANYCLPFCNKNNFTELWNKINDSILKDGYFVGNFFGNNDEWKNTKEEMTFLTKEQVIELFKTFDIIEFKEIEKNAFTGLGKMKHWHIFNVIAKKKMGEKMKVLTIKQPWATLIMQGNKRFEFRSWQTKYRGDLLIHAGKGIDKEATKRLAKYIPKDMPTGKILGKVTLVDCVKLSPEFKEMLLKENKDIYTASSFKENYGWQLEDVEAFDEPIEAKGKLSLWEYDL